MLSDQMLSAETLAAFKVIILANASCLSDSQCEAIRAYVAGGGSVVAAYETSLRDEDGTPRQQFALADVFGAKFRSGPRGIVKNTYVALTKPHPVNDGYDGARRIIGGTRLIDVDMDAGATAPFLYVPDFPDLPMEEVYPREEPTMAAVISKEHEGGGRAVFIPWNIGEIFWEVLAPDHGRLIANSVRWALSKTPKVKVDGPGVLDISYREGPDTSVVGMANLTNPMMMKGPVREVIPVSRQKVSVAIPGGRVPVEARLLIADRAIEHQIKDGMVTVTVPKIERLEFVEITWT